MFKQLLIQHGIIVLFGCCCFTFSNTLFKNQKCVGIVTNTGNNQLTNRLIWASSFRDFNSDAPDACGTALLVECRPSCSPQSGYEKERKWGWVPVSPSRAHL